MSIAYPFNTPDLDDDSPDPAEIYDGVHYPSTDGEEMGENDWHATSLSTLFSMLRWKYHEDGAYVAMDMMLYFEEGNPRAVRAPDCIVVLGASNHRRHSWMTWVEGTVPNVVFELVSKRTRHEDLGPKRSIYERLGIPEYFLFDPDGTIIREDRLRGWRLEAGRYVELDLYHGGLTSEQLGLHMKPEGEILRLLDMVTLDTLKTFEESERLRLVERRFFNEASRDLKRRLRRRTRSRNAEHLRAEAEHLRAEAERLRADALAAELEQLRARIAADPPVDQAEG